MIGIKYVLALNTFKLIVPVLNIFKLENAGLRIS